VTVPTSRRQEPGAAWRLDGMVALVTGARFGIGKAIAVALARAGAHVGITSRHGDDLQQCQADIAAAGGTATALALELRQRSSVDAAVTSITEQCGRLDIVVNNAAYALRKPVEDFEDDEWQAVVDTNLGGVFRMARVAGSLMARGGGGRMVNVSSTYARIALPGRAAYGASKAGIEQLTRALAVEWAPHQITVNAVAPTVVITETRQSLLDDPDFLPTRIAEIPLGRLCETDDVATAVLYLVSPAASYVTGNTLVLDGGLTLR